MMEECDCKKSFRYPKDGAFHPFFKNEKDEKIETGIVPVDMDVVDCVCGYLSKYADFASRKLSDMELDHFYNEIADLWWHNISEEPLCPGTTLDSVVLILKKNLEMATLLEDKFPPSRIDKVEFIERFFVNCHDNDLYSISMPCYRKKDKPINQKALQELNSLGIDVLECLLNGIMRNL